IVPVSSTSDLLESPQLAEREVFWRSGGATYPGAFARFGARPIALRNAAPALDEHHMWERSPERDERGATAPIPLPLDGIKILDFSWVMAGPWSTRALADYGANVVKIESRTRLDLVRILGPFYDDKVSTESSASFASINAGKRSCEVDPNTPEG